MDIRFDSASVVGVVGDSPAVASKTQPSVTETPDLLPGVNALMCSGDPGAMLAALTMQTAHEQQKVARAQRDNCEQAQEKAEQAEIADLRSKADLQRAQGIADGICDFAQAGMDFASGVEKLDATSDDLNANNKDGKDNPKGTLDSNNVRDTAAHEEARANAWKSGSEGMGGVKSILHGAFDGEITDKDTDSKQHDIAAQAFKKMADDAHDTENDAKQLLNKALDFYKEYVDTKNQTVMAAIHRA